MAVTRRKTLRRKRRDPEQEALARRREELKSMTPYLGLVRAPTRMAPVLPARREVTVASYNVHRWTGVTGRARPDPGRAGFVISELGADVIGLQEVLRPFEGDDPLAQLAEALGLHLAFVATRVHRQGELGNAILSRWPILSASLVDLSFSRVERRSAIAAQVQANGRPLAVMATHLALVDRTRHRQVRHLLEHPHFDGGPVVLVGDMNTWRRCRATRHLEDELRGHGELRWPATFPAARPVLALDRVYARDAHVVDVRAHVTAAARRASDHLPVVARVALDKPAA